MRTIFSFGGRLNRRQFFIGLTVGYLVLFAASMILAGLAYAVGPAHGLATVTVAIAAATLLLQLRLLVPRFHDFGWSGWAPAMGLFAAVLLNTGLASKAPKNLDQWVMAPVFLAACLFPGRRGANRFGAAPAQALSDFPLPDREAFTRSPALSSEHSNG